MKKQIIVIHGGDTFDSYEGYLAFLKTYEIDFERYRSGIRDWKQTLFEKLGRDFEVILPMMPNKYNAKYAEWKIWFDKFIPHFELEVILVGHSLGGLFLAKYLSENEFPKKILGTFLVSAPFDDKNSGYSLTDFVLPQSLAKLNTQGGKIFIYHSKDDPIVPVADFEKYKKALPRAQAITFENRGHIRQEEFPEIINNIKSLFA